MTLLHMKVSLFPTGWFFRQYLSFNQIKSGQLASSKGIPENKNNFTLSLELLNVKTC